MVTRFVISQQQTHYLTLKVMGSKMHNPKTHVLPSGSAHADNMDPWCSSGVKNTYCTPEISNKDFNNRVSKYAPYILTVYMG